MGAPSDFGLFQIMRETLILQPWFKSMCGLYTVPPPGAEPPYILLGIEGLESGPNQFAPQARIECSLSLVVGRQHSPQFVWDVIQGISKTLDGQCFDLPGHDHLKPLHRPFVVFREISSGYAPGLKEGRWVNALIKYVCHIRASRGFL